MGSTSRVGDQSLKHIKCGESAPGTRSQESLPFRRESFNHIRFREIQGPSSDRRDISPERPCPQYVWELDTGGCRNPLLCRTEMKLLMEKHVWKHGPVSADRCPWCEETFDDPNEKVLWNLRMLHVAGHIPLDTKADDYRTELALFQFLHSKNIMDPQTNMVFQNLVANMNDDFCLKNGMTGPSVEDAANSSGPPSPPSAVAVVQTKGKGQKERKEVRYQESPSQVSGANEVVDERTSTRQRREGHRRHRARGTGLEERGYKKEKTLSLEESLSDLTIKGPRP